MVEKKTDKEDEVIKCVFVGARILCQRAKKKVNLSKERTYFNHFKID